MLSLSTQEFKMVHLTKIFYAICQYFALVKVELDYSIYMNSGLIFINGFS